MKIELTVPNILTILRIILIPFFIYFLLYDNYVYRIIAFILFAIASITDFIDGYLARKWHEETELGKFLDPLADKFLVVSALTIFVILPDTLVPLWMVLIIIGRDVLITYMRIKANRQGIKFTTSRFGKLKTLIQMFAITAIIIIIILRTYLIHKQNISMPPNQFCSSYTIVSLIKYIYANPYEGILIALPYFLMLIVTIITFISGINYIIKYKSIFSGDSDE